jgi:hypothetical protein
MEHIINAKERNYAFILFLLSFTATVAIIIGAVYFNTLIPGNENDILRKKIADLENQEIEQKQFIAAMEGIQTLNDSLIKLGVVHPLVERGITEHLSFMNHPEHKAGNLYGQLNTYIFNFVYEYTEMNKKLLNLNKEREEIETLKNDLSRIRGELEQANRSLDAYRNSSNLGIR